VLPLETPTATTATAKAPYINPAMMNIDNMLKSISLLNESKQTETNIQKQSAETKKIEVEIENIEAKTNTEILSQTGIELDNQNKELDRKLKEGNLENSFKMLEEQLNQVRTMNEKAEKEIKGLKIDNENKQEMYDLAKKQGAQSIAESISKVALNNANKILTESKTITEESIRREIEEKCNLLIKQTEELQQRIEKGKIDLEYYEILKEAEAEIKDVEAKIQKWEFGKREYMLILTATEKLMNKIF
jgi:hypothetical protein